MLFWCVLQKMDRSLLQPEAGYTGISVGKVDERYVMLPIHSIVDKGARKVELKGRVFERLMTTTGQPNLDSCADVKMCCFSAMAEHENEIHGRVRKPGRRCPSSVFDVSVLFLPVGPY